VRSIASVTGIGVRPGSGAVDAVLCDDGYPPPQAREPRLRALDECADAVSDDRSVGVTPRLRARKTALTEEIRFGPTRHAHATICARIRPKFRPITPGDTMANGQAASRVDGDDMGVTPRSADGSGLHRLRGFAPEMEPSPGAFCREIASAEIARILAEFSTRRDGRVVDGGGLENHCTRKGTGGSNPSPSAKSLGRSSI
jgi:hypothetical protein